jgi:DNA-binding beta-propeller fold protein YncE/predicted nucleic acid-binding protein
MSRKRMRQIIAIVALVLLLALLAAAYVNYRSTRSLGINIKVNEADVLPMPQYLYSFSGTGTDRLIRPLGVLVSGNRVYVTDARRGTLDVFTPTGNKIAVWGKGKLVVPLYVAKHPKTGELWVTDRRLRQVVIFDQNGKFLRYFDPKLPKDQLPKFATGGVQWAPLALAFAPDGTLYITEILNGHRLLIFRPDGAFNRSIGTAGLVNDAKVGQGVFQFPNSVKVMGDEVWVADSNNRRIQIFNRRGDFQRMLVTQGLPRGFDFLPKLKESEPRRLVVVDTLAHDVTIWDAAKAEKILTFGVQGVLEGQFNYPNDTAVDGKRKIFVADSSNGRISVWGWPEVANPIPVPTTKTGWALCLSPLLLLPLLLLLRKRRFFATADFVNALLAAEEAERMLQRRVRWEVTPEDYELLRAFVQGRANMEELLNPVEHSESDAQALRERYELSAEDAIIMSIAPRAKLFCTESGELRRIARVLEIPTVDHLEYISRYEAPKGSGAPTDQSTDRPAE